MKERSEAPPYARLACWQHTSLGKWQAAIGYDLTVMEDYEAYGQLRERPAPGAPPELLPRQPAAERTTRATAPDSLGPATAARRPKRTHWVRNVFLLIVAYFVLAVGTTFQPIPVPLTSMRVAVPFPGGAPVLFGLPNRPFTVLVVGLDRRPGETGASRTDTVLLLRIDPNKHRAAFLSIPRDTMMEIQASDGSYFDDRINTAFVYNYSEEDSSAAPKATMETIEHNLGIKVDHYIIFDQRTARTLIDSLGGVDIDNPKEFGQDNYSDDDVFVVPQYFPVGPLHLDGYQAVAYGRIREGSSDFERIERQQRVAAALISSAASPTTIFKINKLYGAYKDTVNTDMSARQSAGVLSLLKQVEDDDLKTKSLADAAVSCGYCTASIQLLDPVKTQAIIEEAFGDPDAGVRAAELLVAAGVTP
jgi:LCP family protein required for cell wall assembly